MKYIAGIDIGGTKCAVSIGRVQEDGIEILQKEKFLTLPSPHKTVKKLVETLEHMQKVNDHIEIKAIGISCGGPLDSEKGLILSPPNLPGWEQIDIVSPFRNLFGVPTAVQNDANACALAEWMWGAGRGTTNMVFLTFGTGLGAGLILNGKLYTGTNDMAGEAGHIRLEEEGPTGFGKQGSFEGFCSGAGIARFAKKRIEEWETAGHSTAIRKGVVTANDIGVAAQKGDELAISMLQCAGEKLGKGLSILIDILNPQKIVIGGVYLRQENIMKKPMEAVIAREALAQSLAVCEVVSAGLGEQIGDYAALSVARSLL